MGADDIRYDHWDMVEIQDIQKPLPNQQAKADKGKLDITLVPTEIIRAIAEVREYGTRKYKDPENWRKVEKERYEKALFRHFLEYWDNRKGVDEESGILHIKHMACNIAFILELERDEGDHLYMRELTKNAVHRL